MILFLLVSCNKDKGPDLPVITTAVIDSISFSKEVQPIFNSYCVTCHDASHPKLNLQSCCSYYQLWISGFSAPYINTSVPQSSLLYQHISGQLSIMPPMGAIPDIEKNTILKWIEQKAKNN